MIKQEYLNNTIKFLVIVLLMILCIMAVNISNITNNGSQVSNEAKDDANVLLREVTDTAVEAIRERRERKMQK